MGTIPTLIQWNLSSLDTNGAEESVIVSDVSSFQRLSKSGIYWYLGWEKCPVCSEVSSIQGFPYRGIPL